MAPEAAQSGDLALAALATSSVPAEWYSGLSTADQFEYQALFMDDPATSVDWYERRRMISSESLMATPMPLNSNSRTMLSVDAGAFILDSGATIHISPEASDFFDLKPIAPRTIKGIGGSSINATGIGKIRLHLAKGIVITLDPALYVPEAAVQLMSVYVLGSGPQKLVSHFDGDGCWLINRSGVTVASGSLSNLGKHLYTIDMGSPLVEHSFIASRVPDLETWHRHLGHANLRSIVEMSDKGLI